MSKGDLLAWIGILIGLPGFLLLFFSQHVVIASLLVAIGAGMLWVRWYINQPEFTLLLVEKILTINDVEGRTAVLLRCQEGVANQKGLTEFWCRNISADGPITNIRLDDRPPHEVKREAGDTQVCKRFNRALEHGEQFSMKLSYDLTDSFPKSTEGMIHVVECKTKRLKMVVTLPGGRPATAARASLRYGGNPHMRLPQPRLTGQTTGERIEMEIKSPRLGAEYCLEWDW